MKIDDSFFYALICKILGIKIYHFLLICWDEFGKKYVVSEFSKFRSVKRPPYQKLGGPLLWGYTIMCQNFYPKMLLDITLTFICIDLSQFYSAVLEIFTNFILEKVPIFEGLPRKGGMQCCQIFFKPNYPPTPRITSENLVKFRLQLFFTNKP